LVSAQENHFTLQCERTAGEICSCKELQESSKVGNYRTNQQCGRTIEETCIVRELQEKPVMWGGNIGETCNMGKYRRNLQCGGTTGQTCNVRKLWRNLQCEGTVEKSSSESKSTFSKF
ncbi:hypothetical protein OTU49_002580, partial [Cherax quadricarinatus]